MAEMSFEEIQSSFADVASRLDHALVQARARIEAEDITIEDRSNRSGFDGGHHFFVWSFWFERRSARGSEIAAAKVDLSFLEPGTTEAPRIVRATRMAEIFQLGQMSRFKVTKEESYLVDEISSCDLAAFVEDLIKNAEQELP